MTGLEITLTILGTIFVVISFLLTDRKEPEAEPGESGKSIDELWTEKDEKIVRNRVETVLKETADDLVLEAGDQLSKLSNEKILSLNEYSEQVLEKINANHKEVVFLYNMLNEKQDEMKQFVQSFDKQRAKWNDADARDSQMAEKETPKQEKQVESGVDTLKKVVASKTKRTQVPAMEEQGQAPSNAVKDSDAEEEVKDRRDEIFQLRKMGKSIIEISKLLDMGQGEVKLILDLYERA